jgi:hypothetical protein
MRGHISTGFKITDGIQPITRPVQRAGLPQYRLELRFKAFACALLVWMLLVVPSGLWALEATAVVDRTHISPSDTLRLNVTVKDARADVDVSVIEDFKILSRGTSRQVRIINTQYSKEIIYQFVLLPLKEGTLTIPPLSVTHGRTSVYTRPIRVQVSKDRNPADESVTYTIRLFQSVRIDQARLQQPDFKGFSFKEIDEQASYEKVINGRRYGVTEKSCLLTPLASGDLQIGSAELTCDVPVRTSRRSRSRLDSFFDDPFLNPGRHATKVLRTEPIHLQVQPLPPHTGDVAFSGLIGNVTFTAAIEDTRLTAGDSTTLTLTIDGRGNLMDISEPEITLPDGFKIYHDTPEIDVHPTPEGYVGHKTFRIALVPLKAGMFRIPAVQFNYFDTERAAYTTLSSSILSLKALPSQHKPALQVYSSGSDTEQAVLNQKDVTRTGHDILPLKEDPRALHSQKGLPFIYFLMGTILPILIYMAAFIRVKWMRQSMEPAHQRMMKAKTILQEAGTSDIDSKRFGALLYKALLCGISCVGRHPEATVEGASLTHAEIDRMLRESGLSEDTVQQTLEWFKRIEAVRYSGAAVDADTRRALLKETKQILRRLSA